MASVEEARREMITVKVGLFLVERNLTGKSGLQFCRELRRATAHETTPFLLLGTESFRHDIILASEGGVDSYLLKPFSFEDFLGQIDLIITSSQNPSSLKRILERADTHLRNGETWIAESLFMEAQNIKPNSARAMCGLGLVAMQGRDFKAAKEKLRLAISFNPDYLETYQHLLKLAKESDDQSCLLDTAKLLHEMSPENPRYPLIMAELMLQLDDIEAAQTFQKLAEKKSTLLRSNKTDIHPAKDQKSFVSALDLESDDAGLLHSLGLGYFKKNMLDQAIKSFQFALRLNPTDTEVLYNLAMAYELSGDATSATHSLRLAMAANPLFGKAKIKLQELGASATKELPKNVVDNAGHYPRSTDIEKKGA
jgi:tetratricopeptide (TPR) repeat protein